MQTDLGDGGAARPRQVMDEVGNTADTADISRGRVRGRRFGVLSCKEATLNAHFAGRQIRQIAGRSFSDLPETIRSEIGLLRCFTADTADF